MLGREGDPQTARKTIQMRTPESTAPPDRAPTVRIGARAPSDRLVLGRYRLEHRIGVGGFGVVWQAHDEKLERDVAVKVVPREEGQRTTREARAAARLNHPGIVALYELGSDEHDTYLVSELVPGATLGELSAEGALSDRDVARIGGALCEALEHAHARGVVHRDVKPANVMVVAEPAAGAGFAKLTDFGIAHLASGEGLTVTGDVLGTLAYMAPEQAEGGRVSGATDVYSLALTLYEAWTGTNPVRASSPAATARQVGRRLPPMGRRRSDLPAELCSAVDAALDPDPFYRLSPGELREVLGSVEGRLSDEGGLVEPETLERFGLTAVRARTKLHSLIHRGALPQDGHREEKVPLGLVRRLLPRAASGLATGCLLLAALEGLAPESSASPLALGGACALLVMALPRVGWLVTALALCGYLATPEVDRAGVALLLAVALAPVPLLLPRAGLLWSLPALAPLLGTIALAPLFVGVAALPRTLWRRVGLGALGFLWLAVAEALTGSELLFGVAGGTLERASWQDSPIDAAGNALAPMLTSPALAPALVWGAFAVVLPFFARGRWAAVDLVVGLVWVVGLVLAHGALGDLLAATAELDQARGAVAGAALAGLVAITVKLIAPPPSPEQPAPALP